jgi:hypothetical protein
VLVTGVVLLAMAVKLVIQGKLTVKQCREYLGLPIAPGKSEPLAVKPLTDEEDDLLSVSQK